MGDWQSLLQSVVLGLILSFLLAKLISFLTVTRSTSSQRHATDRADHAAGPGPNSTRSGPKPDIGEAREAEPVVAELGSVRSDGMGSGSSGSDDDEDWEGVESTELDEVFSAATAFVAAAAADQLSQKVSTDLQLQLYGLYKIATEGPCNVPQPSALKMTARAKWQAWQKLGAMPPEDAMQKYIDLVTELYPSWADGGSALRSKGNDGGGTSSEAKGTMGPVFSSFVYEEEDSGTESKMDAIHGFAREGDVANLLKCLENGVSVNLKDSEGRTALHWAVDRGHFSVTELLINRNADVNAKDNDGQTPLHYAVICEREAIAECLVKHNADADLKDNDGISPRDLCESNWPWMQQQHVGEAN